MHDGKIDEDRCVWDSGAYGRTVDSSMKRLLLPHRHDRLHVTKEGFMDTKTNTTSRDKVRAHRIRLRKQGLRPIQIWVPDMRSPEFVKEARRQSLAIANSPGEKDDLAFIDSISDWPASDSPE
jgi:hypothetical protein